MATSTINQSVHEVKALSLDTYIPANSSSVWLEPTIPTGYKFLCWLGSASNGWVGSTYIENYTAVNCGVWAVGEFATADRQVRCGYLVYR